jgi:LuxR family quorum-sensing system transcriptional regulator CciR
MPRATPTPAAASLTLRQTQCLAWVAAGKTSAEIGVILGLSALSVDTYVKAARKALGVRTRAQAAATAAKPAIEQNFADSSERSES